MSLNSWTLPTLSASTRQPQSSGFTSYRKSRYLLTVSTRGRPMTVPPHPTKKRRAGPEDVEIGHKIRALRLERGLSQSGLADGIDLTFQQVQKYEKGTNRVSAGRLQRIADILNTPVMFFYGGMGAGAKERDRRNTSLAFLQTKGAVRLIR